jgi:predicted phosphohydrolase
MALIVVAVLWPVHGKQISRHWFSTIEQNDIVLRVLMLVDAIYMMAAFKKVEKYKMTASKV